MGLGSGVEGLGLGFLVLGLGFRVSTLPRPPNGSDKIDTSKKNKGSITTLGNHPGNNQGFHFLDALLRLGLECEQKVVSEIPETWLKTDGRCMLTLRVQVPNDEILGYWVRVSLVQVLCKYMLIGYLDP